MGHFQDFLFPNDNIAKFVPVIIFIEREQRDRGDGRDNFFFLLQLLWIPLL